MTMDFFRRDHSLAALSGSQAVCRSKTAKIEDHDGHTQAGWWSSLDTRTSELAAHQFRTLDHESSAHLRIAYQVLVKTMDLVADPRVLSASTSSTR
jgi:hypothetical protein